MSLEDKTIDKNIPVPLYYQLKQHLLEHIKTSQVGDHIPTEAELCQLFQVSRPTVRQAISELVSEGYVTRNQGKGTFITKPKVQRDFQMGLRSFNEEMAQSGKKPSTKVEQLCTVEADAWIAEKLKLNPRDPLVFMRRVRYADGIPVMVVNSFLPSNLFHNLEFYDFSRVGLHTLINETYQYKIVRSIKTFEAIGIPKNEAKLLETDTGSPGLYLETLVYKEQEIPIEFSIAWYKGSTSKFTYELNSV